MPYAMRTVVAPNGTIPMTDAGDPQDGPPPETLRARRQLSESRFGRWGRVRSLVTILCGLLALALLFLLMGQTD